MRRKMRLTIVSIAVNSTSLIVEVPEPAIKPPRSCFADEYLELWITIQDSAHGEAKDGPHGLEGMRDGMSFEAIRGATEADTWIGRGGSLMKYQRDVGEGFDVLERLRSNDHCDGSVGDWTDQIPEMHGEQSVGDRSGELVYPLVVDTTGAHEKSVFLTDGDDEETAGGHQEGLVDAHAIHRSKGRVAVPGVLETITVLLHDAIAVLIRVGIGDVFGRN
jgi:hypothetical protein